MFTWLFDLFTRLIFGTRDEKTQPETDEGSHTIPDRHFDYVELHEKFRLRHEFEEEERRKRNTYQHCEPGADAQWLLNPLNPLSPLNPLNQAEPDIGGPEKDENKLDFHEPEPARQDPPSFQLDCISPVDHTAAPVVYDTSTGPSYSCVCDSGNDSCNSDNSYNSD